MTETRMTPGRFAAALFPLLLLCMCIPAEVRAQQQQWATDVSTNNVNTATGVNNVGVGTPYPAEKLTVAGSIAARGTSAIDGSQLIITNNDTTGPWLGAHTDRQGNSTANYAAPRLNIQAAGIFFQFSPATPVGAARAWTTRLAISSADGNVGVGTTTPTDNLDVYDGAASNPDARIRSRTTNVSASFGAAEGGGRYFTHSPGLEIMTHTNSPISFGVNVTAGDATPSMVIASGGNVGIGTTSPGASYRLDVNGSANVTGSVNVTQGLSVAGVITGGTINARYQDVAEWVPSSQKLSAGTVVVLDPGKTNHVLASTKAYDTAVAGVVSDSPGVILGVGGEGALKVATTGRVRVRVDAKRAPVKVGDLLVTSEVEGVAMKSVEVNLGGVRLHRPGTIIGKALEPLASGTGEILVLLSLQ